MAIPFSRAQFFDVLALYNEAVWPVQLLLLALAVSSVAAVIAGREWHGAIGGMLAALWLWMAVAYHLVFFTMINPAAWLFGGAFVLAAFFFAWHALRGTLKFALPKGPDAAPGLILLAYALVGYPLIGGLVGHVYPRVPTFGLPCPTTIFTLALLLFARRPVPWTLFVVPFAWSIVGTIAALEFGVVQDFGLGAAALVAIAVLALRLREHGRGHDRGAMVHHVF
jgi:hypothetical protein